MIESGSSPAELLPGEEQSAAPISVLGVAADPDGEEGLGELLAGDSLADADQISVATVTTPAAAPAHVDAADCVVGGPDLSDADRLELLETIRDRDRTVPTVLLAANPSRAVRDALAELDWTERLRPATTRSEYAHLADRIRTVVGYRRATDLARRSLAALAHGSDAVAIVTPDGTVEYVNTLFARQFGAAPPELVGRPWRALFPDSEVARLESDAFPSLADGWRWIGDCELRRADGSTFTAQTRIDALDDDSLVFTVSDRPVDEN
ncbi:PAS domain-containing protein [Halobacteria archaeon HArc-gm2]|nr:PAS domain-containing protein [Halobacteria archaeon HArc-gm2]